MFEGEKTIVFWIGLIILGLASVGLLGILWGIAVWDGPGPYAWDRRFAMLKQAVPVIVGGVVFILIGLYMMKSGVKRSEVEESKVSKGDAINICAILIGLALYYTVGISIIRNIGIWLFTLPNFINLYRIWKRMKAFP